MFKCRKTLNVSAVLVNWHFTASVVNLVIINAYLSYLRQSFINNAYSKIESLYLIAHPSKNVNALEVCWCSPFSIVKIYFHHRLHFFFFFSCTLLNTGLSLKEKWAVKWLSIFSVTSVTWLVLSYYMSSQTLFWVWEKFPIPQFTNICTLWEILYWLLASNTSFCKQP